MPKLILCRGIQGSGKTTWAKQWVLEDPRAPWNAPLDVKHKRFVSVTISYYDEVELPPDAEDSQIEEAIIEKVKRQDFPKKVDFDEIVILDE